MGNIKLNKDNNGVENNSYMKQEIEEGRKLFANKKANKALAIAGVIIGSLILGAIIFVYLV